MEKLIQLLGKDENKICADCKKPEANWCNVPLGTFICSECVGVHQTIPEINGNIARIEDYSWKEEEISRLVGNELNKELEKFIPPYFVTSRPGVEQVYEEIFTRAKYVTKLFVSESIQAYHSATSGKKSGGLLFVETTPTEGSVLWYPRYVCLEAGEVSVYESRSSLEPLFSMKLEDLVVRMEQEEGTVTKGLVFIHFYKSGTCPNTYYFFTYPKDTIDWYYALKAAQMNVTQKHSIERTILAASTSLNRSGYMHKTGSHINDKWRKRWFVVRDTTVCYYKNKDSKKPKGVFTLCGNTRVSRVESGPLYHTHKSPTPHTFLVTTPNRIYRMCADSVTEQDAWVKMFENILFLKYMA